MKPIEKVSRKLLLSDYQKCMQIMAEHDKDSANYKFAKQWKDKIDLELTRRDIAHERYLKYVYNKKEPR